MELIKKPQSLAELKKQEIDKVTNEVSFHIQYRTVLESYAQLVEAATTFAEVDAAVEWFEANEPEFDKYVIDDILSRKD